MTDLFQNRYRTSSISLQNWDYRCTWPYFITICTKTRKHFFSEIFNGHMILSHAGVIADILCQEIIIKQVVFTPFQRSSFATSSDDMWQSQVSETAD